MRDAFKSLGLAQALIFRANDRLHPAEDRGLLLSVCAPILRVFVSDLP